MQEEATSVDLATVRARFHAMRKDLCTHFLEREEAVEVAQLSMLSGTNPLFLGPPGTAKSAVFNGVMAWIQDARRMYKLVTQFTTEDELIGPPKLSALKNDVFDRNLDGGLAGVEVAMLDEVFKGSSSILNTTLTCINEHTYNGKAVPLRMCVAASNELPTDELLGAINDRFLLRAMVGDLTNDGSFDRLLALAASPAKRAYVPSDGLTVAEWDAALADVATVTVSERVRMECIRLRREVSAKGIYVSPRRWVMLVRVLQAAAWLDGSAEVELDHLAVLKYGLWTALDQRDTVEAIVKTVDAGVTRIIVETADEALREADALANLEPALRKREIAVVAGKLADAGQRIKDTVKAGVSKRAFAKASEKQAELRDAYNRLKDELAKKLNLNNFTTT